MAGIEYYFNNLDPNTFQRLISAILVARFGEGVRLTPRFGSDGGRDGETAPSNPYFEFQVNDVNPPPKGIFSPPQKGRYLFQVKHHRTIDTRLSDARSTVVADFEKELKKNVLDRQGEERINFFFLITNVPSSEKVIAEIDKRQKELRETYPSLYVDVWWGERVEAFLDQMPFLWHSFPDLFAGRKVPFLAEVADDANIGLPRAIRLAIERQYQRESNIKFRQIDLEKRLQKLFTVLDISTHYLPTEEQQKMLSIQMTRRNEIGQIEPIDVDITEDFSQAYYHNTISALKVLLDETIKSTRKIILEGGPGQGKSTITQMVTQIYRQQLLHKDDLDPENRWKSPQKSRFPFRVELRFFAEWYSKNSGSSVEEYLAFVFKQDSGGNHITVDDIHNIVESSPVVLVFDGLDEVGNDDLRNDVLVKIAECIDRFENGLRADVHVIITTRPPTVADCRDHLVDFMRLPIAPMSPIRIEEYVGRWLAVQLQDEDEKQEVQEAFEKRQNEPHVQAFIKNPMQLSVLLHFIRLKGSAFPDRRAELYREYFKTVIDRDVEKSLNLRDQRETIESLHKFLGYKIHALTEAKLADGSLRRTELLKLVEAWLKSRGSVSKTAQELFKLGEERLGLIVALRGEGEETIYGYEIQPIREYFAAAYINDDIQGDAHEVFQTMIRRPFWREVSLFLAGLRRPNEKADLVARAKALDKDEELGWRQDGRGLTLQLLQEGVFSEPPHIFSDALDFVFDLLDPKLVEVQNEPKELLNVLPSLIKHDQITSKHYIERLLALIHDYNTTADEHVLFRIYRVASQILEPEKMKKELFSYQGKIPDIIAKVRLLWPSSWQIDVQELFQNLSFWEGVPNSLWSEYLWHTTINFNIKSKLLIPPTLHLYLVEQFIFNSLSIRDILNPTTFTINSNWAIWKLVNAHRLLATLSLFLFEDVALFENPQISETKGIVAQKLAFEKDSEIDFVGLDEEMQSAISKIINLYYKLIEMFLIEEGKQIDPVLEDFILTIRKYFKYPGLISWFACRIATNILQIFLVRRYRPIDFFPSQQIWSVLWSELAAFYANLPNNSGDEKEELLRFAQLSSYEPMVIRYVRLNDGNLVDAVKLLASNICRGDKFPHDWMDRMPITTSILRPLVENCREQLLTLLVSLSERYVERNIHSSPLLTSDVQRILRIVRNTNDPKVLSGALIALSSSKFLRLAGSQLTLKMICADLTKADFAVPLFNLENRDKETPDVRETLKEIAIGILKSPKDYALKITLASTSYLAQYSPVNVSPLLSMENELKLYISV